MLIVDDNATNRTILKTLRGDVGVGAHRRAEGEIDEPAIDARRMPETSLPKFVARVGGEEFTAILPETDIEQAKQTAEALHAATKGSPIDTSAGALAVTVSIGISAVEAGENDARAALRRTDRALYQAKAAGRDQYAALAK